MRSLFSEILQKETAFMITYNRELNSLRMNYISEKIRLFHCMNFGKHLTIRDEHGIHCILSTLADCYFDAITKTSTLRHNCNDKLFMM